MWRSTCRTLAVAWVLAGCLAQPPTGHPPQSEDHNVSTPTTVAPDSSRPKPTQSATSTPIYDTYLYRCNGGKRFVAHFEDQKLTLFLPHRQIVLTRQAYRPGGVLYEDPVHDIDFYFNKTRASLRTPTEWFLGCRNDRSAAVWEAAKLKGFDFRAVGNEPPWILLIQNGTLILQTGYGKKQSLDHAMPRQQSDPPATYYKGAKMTVILRPGPCRDTMADETYETSVEIHVGQQILRGCGRALH